MYKIITTSELESSISDIIDSHREEMYRRAEQEMYCAFNEIAAFLKNIDESAISRRSINGLSAKSIREISRVAKKGDCDFYTEWNEGRISEELNLDFLIEFLKVRSLTFEATRIRYPNYLKPWKTSDDLELERLWCEGMTVEDLAKHFKRNPGAIAARIEKLELIDKYR